MSLAQKAARGAAWTIVFGLLARGIGVAGTLVMTHLIVSNVRLVARFFRWAVGPPQNQNFLLNAGKKDRKRVLNQGWSGLKN